MNSAIKKSIGFALALALIIALFTTDGAVAQPLNNRPDNTNGRHASLTENHITTPHFYQGNLKRPPDQPAPRHRRTIQNHQPDLWLYEVSIGLNSDHDSDGHYSNFTITLDFDTTLSSPLVYAVLYVSIDNGPWNEYAVSGNFTINGANANDAYTIHATLDTGYPTGYYDHYVELYDAHSHDFLISYGPHDSHYFYHLPFESTVHDDHHYGFSSTVSFSFSGTGSLGPFSLSLLGLLFGCRAAGTMQRPTRRS